MVGQLETRAGCIADPPRSQQPMTFLALPVLLSDLVYNG